MKKALNKQPVTFRVDAAMLTRMTAAAKAARRTLSDWVRLTVEAALTAKKGGGR